MMVVANRTIDDLDEKISELQTAIRLAFRHKDIAPAGNMLALTNSGQLGAFLRAERVTAKLTEEQLAGAVNQTPEMIRVWEAGTFKNINYLIAILEGLGCKLWIEVDGRKVPPAATRDPQLK